MNVGDEVARVELVERGRNEASARPRVCALAALTSVGFLSESILRVISSRYLISCDRAFANRVKYRGDLKMLAATAQRQSGRKAGRRETSLTSVANVTHILISGVGREYNRPIQPLRRLLQNV